MKEMKQKLDQMSKETSVPSGTEVESGLDDKFSVPDDTENNLESGYSGKESVSDEDRSIYAEKSSVSRDTESSTISVPLKDLIVLEGSLEGKRVQVLKDDGCNTNVVSHDFFERNQGHFKWDVCDVEVRHSKADSVENS